MQEMTMQITGNVTFIYIACFFYYLHSRYSYFHHLHCPLLQFSSLILSITCIFTCIFLTRDFFTCISPSLALSRIPYFITLISVPYIVTAISPIQFTYITSGIRIFRVIGHFKNPTKGYIFEIRKKSPLFIVIAQFWELTSFFCSIVLIPD